MKFAMVRKIQFNSTSSIHSGRSFNLNFSLVYGAGSDIDVSLEDSLLSESSFAQMLSSSNVRFSQPTLGAKLLLSLLMHSFGGATFSLH
jgi:hypothetical protein